MGKRQLPWAKEEDHDKEAKSKAPAKRQKTDSTMPEAHSTSWNDVDRDAKMMVADLIKNRALERQSVSWETLRDLSHFAQAYKENAGLFNRQNLPETTFKKFKSLGQLSRLAKDLYEKIMPEDAFAENTDIGDFWEWSGADPVRNLRTASPLFRAQREDVRSTLINDVLNLGDKAMKARCLKQIAEDPNYIDHIDNKDHLERLHSATSGLERYLNRHAPHEVDLRESVRLLQKRIDGWQDSFGDISGSQDRSSGSSSGQSLSPAPEKNIASTIAALKDEIGGFTLDDTDDEHHTKARSIGDALMTAFDSERSKIISGQYDRNKLETVIDTEENDIPPEEASRNKPETAVDTEENEIDPDKANRDALANAERSRDRSPDRAG